MEVVVDIVVDVVEVVVDVVVTRRRVVLVVRSV